MLQPFIINHTPGLIVAQGPRQDNLEHEFCRCTFRLGIYRCSFRHIERVLSISQQDEQLAQLVFLSFL